MSSSGNILLLNNASELIWDFIEEAHDLKEEIKKPFFELFRLIRLFFTNKNWKFIISKILEICKEILLLISYYIEDITTLQWIKIAGMITDVIKEITDIV